MPGSTTQYIETRHAAKQRAAQQSECKHIHFDPRQAMTQSSRCTHTCIWLYNIVHTIRMAMDLRVRTYSHASVCRMPYAACRVHMCIRIGKGAVRAV